MRKQNLLGRRFGRLLVTEEMPSETTGSAKRKRCIWKCVCDCGNIVNKKSEKLLQGTMSCGCLHSESTSKINSKHGMYQTDEHRAWRHMKNRCFNPNDRVYVNYGGRGITVCDRWKDSFENFYADMGNRPSKLHSIDRIDVNGNYEPANCRWATIKEQARNKRGTFYAEYNGERLPLKTWCERLNLDYVNTHHDIVRKNYSLQQIIHG